MPCLRRQLVAVAVAARRLIGCTAAGQNHRRRSFTLSPCGYGTNQGAIPKQQMSGRGIVANPHLLAQQFRRQRLGHISSTVRLRKNPLAALHFQRHAQLLKKIHHRQIIKGRKRAVHKPPVAGNIADKLIHGGRIGNITAPLAGNRQFAPQTVIFLPQRNLAAGPGRPNCRHTACRTAADNQNICHKNFSPKQIPNKHLSNKILSAITHEEDFCKPIFLIKTQYRGVPAHPWCNNA